MRTIPLQDRPRERLLRLGGDALSIPELLAILLGTGTREKPVLLLTQELVLKFGGIQGLLEATVEELQEIKGIGEAKAIQLKAAFAIAQKAVSKTKTLRPYIEGPEDVVPLVQEQIGSQKQEEVIVLLRDTRGRMFHYEKVGIGTVSEVLVHPREIFHPAVKHKAHSLIVAHNHPSGDISPSLQDLDLTRLLLHCSRVMNIALDDHLIVTDTAYTSLRERGLLGTRFTYNV